MSRLKIFSIVCFLTLAMTSICFAEDEDSFLKRRTEWLGKIMLYQIPAKAAPAISAIPAPNPISGGEKSTPIKSGDGVFIGTLQRMEGYSTYMQGDYKLVDDNGNLVCLIGLKDPRGDLGPLDKKIDPYKDLEIFIGCKISIEGAYEPTAEPGSVIITSVDKITPHYSLYKENIGAVIEHLPAYKTPTEDEPITLGGEVEIITHVDPKTGQTYEEWKFIDRRSIIQTMPMPPSNDPITLAPERVPQVEPATDKTPVMDKLGKQIIIEDPNPNPNSHLPGIGRPVPGFNPPDSGEVLERIGLEQTLSAQAQDRRFSGQMACSISVQRVIQDEPKQ